MAVGRSRCVIPGVNPKKQIMPHDEFISRIKKSLYYGSSTKFEDMSVSGPLAEYASELFSEPHKGHSLNRLNKVTAGDVHTSPCSLIMALIYLDRLQATDPSYVRRITPSELFIVSMMVSTKFYCGHDEDVYISDWAKEGNMSEEQIKKLELEFLCAIDWNIYISNDQFFTKLTNVEKILAKREFVKRGWLTYTELCNFLPSFTLAKFFLNNIAVIAVSYAASVMTIAGAFFLVSHIPGNTLRKQSSTNIQVGTGDLIESGSTSSSPSDVVLNRDAEVSNNNNNNNDLCAAMIEEELIKIECQYNETAGNDANVKNNENAGPLINLDENYLVKSTRIGIDTGVNWQSFMDDENNCKNCTDTILWHSFLNRENIFFIYTPFTWFKFI